MDEVTTAMEASTYFVVSNQFRSLQGQMKLLVIKLLRQLRAGGQTTDRMTEWIETQREKKDITLQWKRGHVYMFSVFNGALREPMHFQIKTHFVAD